MDGLAARRIHVWQKGVVARLKPTVFVMRPRDFFSSSCFCSLALHCSTVTLWHSRGSEPKSLHAALRGPRFVAICSSLCLLPLPTVRFLISGLTFLCKGAASNKVFTQSGFLCLNDISEIGQTFVLGSPELPLSHLTQTAFPLYLLSLISASGSGDLDAGLAVCETPVDKGCGNVALTFWSSDGPLKIRRLLCSLL